MGLGTGLNVFVVSFPGGFLGLGTRLNVFVVGLGSQSVALLTQ